MLTILEVYKTKEKAWYKKLHDSAFGSKPEAILEVVNGVPYVRIVVEKTRRSIPWKRVSLLSLDCHNQILAPKDLKIPQESGLKRFIPDKFSKRMLENLLFYCLDNLKNPRVVKIAVCAKDDIQRNILEKIVEKVGEVRAICDEPTKLSDLQSKILEESGAAIMVTSDYSAADTCDIIYAPDGIPNRVLGNKKAVIFSPTGRCEGTVIRTANADIPKWLSPAYSAEYDKGEFLAAFYEAGEVKRIENIIPKSGNSSIEKYDADKICDMINGNTK